MTICEIRNQQKISLAIIVEENIIIKSLNSPHFLKKFCYIQSIEINELVNFIAGL